jgi:4'-phosphopantetheinyl transferase
MLNILGVKFSEKLDDVTLDTLLSILRPSDREKIQRYKFWQDRQRGLFGKILVFKLLKDDLALDEFPELFYDMHNRPFQKISSKHDFNITHSGDYVFCAISDNGKTGIDVEKDRDMSFDIAERFFSKYEIEYLSGLSGRQKIDEMIKLWTLKEAYIKARGRTFLIPLDRFYFDISDINDIKFFHDLPDDNEEWKFSYYPLDNGHHLSVCLAKYNEIGSFAIHDVKGLISEFM